MGFVFFVIPCSVKNEEIQRLKEENEDLKNNLRLKLKVSEGELVLQKQVGLTEMALKGSM